MWWPKAAITSDSSFTTIVNYIVNNSQLLAMLQISLIFSFLKKKIAWIGTICGPWPIGPNYDITWFNRCWSHIYIYIKVRSDMNHNMNLGRSLTLLLVLNSAILETYPGSSFEQPVTYPTKLQYHMVQPMLIWYIQW